MKQINPSGVTRVKIIITLLFLSSNFVNGQESAYPYFYRVFFRDKGENPSSTYTAEDILSSKAIDRRQKAGIPFPDFRDVPVDKDYLNIISRLGLKLHTTSKWMNTALFKSQFLFDINTLLNLSFVSEVKIVKTPGKKTGLNNKLDFQVVQSDLPSFDRPITMINGYPIHDSGYDGKNVLIAVLDGGFMNADQMSSLNGLRNRNGIKTTYDFVKKNKTVYNSSTHGTAVLSVLAGNLPGLIAGTAPGADYLLLKTEDVESEFPCEEDFWAAGAEYADSTGADIISSSLGYFNFDDSTLNYKYSDLDGKTAFVTIVAEVAASKGILVVNSAGNERNSFWKRIIFPSDGASVIAVGAVDGNNIIAGFSSPGPTADGRIKPDNTTMGVSIPVQTSSTIIGRSDGTSFSCPVLSGMAACLLQAVPGALNNHIIEVLHSSADRYNHPDSLYGYGIPDFVLALEKLQDLYFKVPDEGILAYPNPTSGTFEIIFRTPPESFTIEIISFTGKQIFRKKFAGYVGRTLLVAELLHCDEGVYFVRIINSTSIKVQKIIKLKKGS
ncbi:MAG TPA: S8 family serine peptidase [Bacteroidales bacterium]